MEFTSADIFQHSPFGDVLNSLRSLSLSGESWPNYVRLEWDADDEEIRCPPTTHLVATVDDLTDMLDFGSEDFDSMDGKAGDEQDPPPSGHWTATSSYDIYIYIYIWWTPPKKPTARRKRRMTSPRSNPSADVSGTAISPATVRAVIPAHEIITIRIAPKTTTIPSSMAKSWRTNKLALQSRPADGEPEEDNYMPLSED